MTLKGDEEFYMALAIYGGLIFAGALISIGLILVGVAVKNRLTKSKLKNELYNEKERKNGQSHRGGARAKF